MIHGQSPGEVLHFAVEWSACSVGMAPDSDSAPSEHLWRRLLRIASVVLVSCALAACQGSGWDWSSLVQPGSQAETDAKEVVVDDKDTVSERLRKPWKPSSFV